MRVEILCEYTKCSGDEPGDSVGVTAGASARNLAQPPVEQLHLILCQVTSPKLLEGVSNRGKPEHARPALAGALACHIAR